MEEIGLREMRQNAGDLVRRAEAGETITITVAGRAAAVLAPTSSHRWRRWDDIAAALPGHVDEEWQRDRQSVDQDLGDPPDGPVS